MQNKIKIEEIQLTSPNENTPSKQENIKSVSENLWESKDDNQISNKASIKKDDNKVWYGSANRFTIWRNWKS